MKRSKKKALNRHVKPGPMNINLNDLPDIEWKCGNKTFIQGKTMKKMSEVHPANKTGKAQYVNIAAAICLKCFEPCPEKP